MREDYFQGFHERGYLPHQKQAGATYFVTFRLADSLPRAALERLAAELRESNASSGVMATADGIERERRRRIEAMLDDGGGACWLRRPELAELVKGAFRHFEGERYELHAWVVMPNHKV